MHLHITYRLLREGKLCFLITSQSQPTIPELEIESLVTAHVSSTLQALSLPQHLLTDVKDGILRALETDGTWVERYNATKEIDVSDDAVRELPENSDDKFPEDIRKVTDIVIEVCHIAMMLYGRNHDAMISESSTW